MHRIRVESDGKDERKEELEKMFGKGGRREEEEEEEEEWIRQAFGLVSLCVDEAESEKIG